VFDTPCSFFLRCIFLFLFPFLCLLPLSLLSLLSVVAWGRGCHNLSPFSFCGIYNPLLVVYFYPSLLWLLLFRQSISLAVFIDIFPSIWQCFPLIGNRSPRHSCYKSEPRKSSFLYFIRQGFILFVPDHFIPYPLLVFPIILFRKTTKVLTLHIFFNQIMITNAYLLSVNINVLNSGKQYFATTVARVKRIVSHIQRETNL